MSYIISEATTQSIGGTAKGNRKSQMNKMFAKQEMTLAIQSEMSQVLRGIRSALMSAFLKLENRGFINAMLYT